MAVDNTNSHWCSFRICVKFKGWVASEDSAALADSEALYLLDIQPGHAEPTKRDSRQDQGIFHVPFFPSSLLPNPSPPLPLLSPSPPLHHPWTLYSGKREEEEDKNSKGRALLFLFRSKAVYQLVVELWNFIQGRLSKFRFPICVRIPTHVSMYRTVNETKNWQSIWTSVDLFEVERNDLV